MISRIPFLPMLIATGCALLSAASSAATPPPPFPFDSIKPTLRFKPVTQLQIGQFSIFLEVTTLPNVQKAIGVGSERYRGDGAEATSWLCYTLDNSVPHQRLWIMSNAEMGGPEKFVDGIIAQLADGVNSTSDCPSLPPQFQPPAFDHAIWLGQSAKSLRSMFGSPSKNARQWEEYSYAGKIRGDGKCAPDGYDVTASVTVKTAKGQITEIHVGQTTSC